MTSKDNETIRKAVYQTYSNIASTQNLPGGDSAKTSCCGPVLISPSPQKAVSCCDPSALRPAGAKLGCGNPLALASLKPGETVVDLGCGGGFECFAAAGQVGDEGRVIGVDMTPDMIAKARANTVTLNAKNVEFRLGEIEHLPIADNTADIIISNCVINLAPDKLSVYREAFRVLKPGGRLAISDTMATAPLPEEIKKDLGLWSCCISGAVTAEETRELLEEAGFADIRITENKESRELVESWRANSGHPALDIVSAYFEAVKPLTKNIEITIPDSPDWADRVKEKALMNAIQYGSCTQSILSAFLEEFKIDDPLLIRAAGAMHIGMLTSLTCGIHSAAMMVLGVVMGRENLQSGHDGMIPIMGPGQQLIRRITDTIGGDSCRSLSGVDFTDLHQAIAFRASKDAEKCLYRMRDGAGEIARFLQEMNQKGEIFRSAG